MSVDSRPSPPAFVTSGSPPATTLTRVPLPGADPWAERLQRHAPRLLASAPRLVRLGIALEDALEAVHEALFEALALTDPPAEEYTWHFLWTRAVWRAADIARHRRRSATLLPPTALAATAWPTAEAPDYPEVSEAVRQLPDGLRAVVRCLFYDGLTLRETAALLDIDVGTVKRRQARAKKLLRLALTNLAALLRWQEKPP